MWVSLLGNCGLGVLAAVTAWLVVFRYVVPSFLFYSVAIGTGMWALGNAVAFFANAQSFGGFPMVMLFVVGLSFSVTMSLVAMTAFRSLYEGNIDYHRVSELSSF